MESQQLILTPFKKAVNSLADALAQDKNEYTRDAVIQRFEYTFELAWKMLKRYLASQAGVEEYNIKNLFRVAQRQSLINNLDAWFEFHKARNLTVHTYNEKVAEETYKVAQQFLPEVQVLLKNLEKADDTTH